MEQLIELLKQIQELAGVGVDALEGGAEKGKGPDDAPGGEPAPEAAAEGGPPRQ